MNFINKLFPKKKTEEPSTAKVTIVPNLYNIGWEININNLRKTSCEWQRVNETEANEIKEKLKAEIENMEKILEEAHAQKKEFVNLNDNVFRLSDVSSITSYCYKI